MHSALKADAALPAPKTGHSFVRDLPYGAGERNKLDLYIPAGVSNPPLVLFIHGGSWFRGDKVDVLKYERLDRLLALGFAVASMNYTYSQQAIWPAQLVDLETAVGFLASRAGDYGYDTARFTVWGQSSGAHMALWAGVISARGTIPEVRALVGWFPPANLYQLWHDREADEVPRGNENAELPTPESRLLGCDAQANRAAAEAASPDVAAAALEVGQVFPPTLLVHGTADPAVSPLQSARVRDVLAGRGTEVDLIEVPGGRHGGEGFDDTVEPCLKFLVAQARA
ncbi:alpha/beta hydrolase [Oceanicola sp. D3]|uniref:alpha/beta hydrolase n=1 Tax=Oceanicola sp. D3 TaxID=2587163 RepID=UPI0011240A3F|nr:alpha/beta hydrolase [Oceanicola sp. D3]QDC10633.1 alpha/beta hydrolase [Oceanicola sp. D3]